MRPDLFFLRSCGWIAATAPLLWGGCVDAGGAHTPGLPAAPAAVVDFTDAQAAGFRPGILLELDSTRALAATMSDSRVWVVPYADSDRPRVLLQNDPRSHAGIVSIAVANGRMGVLDRLGTLTIYDTADWRVAARLSTRDARRQDGNMAPLGLRGASDSSWLTLVRESSPSAAGPGRRQQLSLYRVSAHAPPRRVWSRPLWTYGQIGPEIFDVSGLGGMGDTVVVSGSYPPRLVAFDLRASTVAGIPLHSVRRRKLDRGERKELERQLAGIPGTRPGLAPPVAHAAIVQAWPRGHGFLALAAGNGRTHYLDWYCDGRFTRTLLSSDVAADVLSDGRIAGVLDRAGTRTEMRIYPIDALDLSC